jgi:polar amino acid transport system substrate-binding protein
MLGSAMLALAPAAMAQRPSGVLGRILQTGRLRVGLLDEELRPDIPDYEKGQLSVERALAEQIASDLGVTLEVHMVAAGDRIAALQQDRVDLVAALMPITPDTLREVAFVSPHGGTNLVVVAPPSSALQEVAELADQRVVAPRGLRNIAAVRRYLPPTARLALLDDDLAVMRAAARGDAFGVLDSRAVRMLSLEHADLHAATRLVLIHWHYALAIRLGEPDLLRYLDTVMFLRRADGTLDDLFDTYLRAPVRDLPRFR